MAPLLTLMLLAIVAFFSAVDANDDWKINPNLVCTQHQNDSTAYWYTGVNMTLGNAGRAEYRWKTKFADHEYQFDLFRRDDGTTSLEMQSQHGGDRQFKVKIRYTDADDMIQTLPFWLSQNWWYCLPKIDQYIPINFNNITSVEIRERCTRGVLDCQTSKHTPIEHP